MGRHRKINLTDKEFYDLWLKAINKETKLEQLEEEYKDKELPLGWLAKVYEVAQKNPYDFIKELGGIKALSEHICCKMRTVESWSQGKAPLPPHIRYLVAKLENLL